MPLRAGGSGEKKAILINALLRQLHGKGSERQRRFHQDGRAGGILLEENFEVRFRCRAFCRTEQAFGLNRFVAHLQYLSSAELQSHLIRSAEEHGLRRGQTAFAQLVSHVVQKCERVFAASGGAQFGFSTTLGLARRCACLCVKRSFFVGLPGAMLKLPVELLGTEFRRRLRAVIVGDGEAGDARIEIEFEVELSGFARARRVQGPFSETEAAGPVYAVVQGLPLTRRDGRRTGAPRYYHD